MFNCKEWQTFSNLVSPTIDCLTSVIFAKVLYSTVQLNVHNPHFLIQQGRISTVVNMKPKAVNFLFVEYFFLSDTSKGHSRRPTFLTYFWRFWQCWRKLLAHHCTKIRGQLVKKQSKKRTLNLLRFKQWETFLVIRLKLFLIIINLKLINEEIGPNVNRLMKDRQKSMEYETAKRKLEIAFRKYICYQYLTCEKKALSSDKVLEESKGKLLELNKKIEGK